MQHFPHFCGGGPPPAPSSRELRKPRVPPASIPLALRQHPELLSTPGGFVLPGGAHRSPKPAQGL